MTYLIAIFIPPLYFILKKKWLAAAGTMFLFLLSLPLFFLLPVFWIISSVCAVWDLRKSMMREHAKMIAEEIAKAKR